MTSSPETPKVRPILFSAPMIRALIDGQKTQTRRIMKVQPPASDYKLSTCVATTGSAKAVGKQHWVKVSDCGYRILDDSHPYFLCPYGKPGDLLWVRETFQIDPSGYGPTRIYYPANDQDMHVDHSGKPDLIAQADRLWTEPGVCRPSIHIPRWASRLTLELTGVRVERLNDISEEDAKSEGIFEAGNLGFYMYDSKGTPGKHCCDSARSTYACLWESINGPASLQANPFVWVLEFRVHQQNIDALLAERRPA